MDSLLQEEVSQGFRYDPPSTYSYKIRSFSSCQNLGIESCRSSPFPAGGYEWELLLYPNGDRDKNGNDHISLYLTTKNSLPPDWEVRVKFRFFVLDQIRNTYETLRDHGERVARFHNPKSMLGFPQFMTLKAFRDPANGFLVDDTCEFGVEIFSVQVPLAFDRLSLEENTRVVCWTWKLQKFSELTHNCVKSEVITAGDYKWYISVYPRGNGSGKNNSFSTFINIANPDLLAPGEEVYIAFRIRLRSLKSGHNIQHCGSTWFKDNIGHGFPSFIELDELNNPRKGYLVNDTLTIEAEVAVHGQKKQVLKTNYRPYSRSKLSTEVKTEGVKLTCAVCMDTMKDETSTTCGHLFCKACISNAIHNHNRCPVCQKDLSMGNLHRIYLPESIKNRPNTEKISSRI